MTSAALPIQTNEKTGVGERQPGTRNLLTCSGESRSQLFQRLRSECVWDAAERLKEDVRTESRNRGETKRQAGIAAWNAIAEAYSIPDAVTWNAFVSRSHRAPGISTVADVTDDSASLAGAWAVSLKLLGSLSTRCPEVNANCHPVLDAIDLRLSMEPAAALIVSEAVLDDLIKSMVENPSQYMEAAQRLFSTYKTTDSSYSAAVADELHKLCQLMELSTPLIETQWPRISLWLWGPRAADVTKYLTRACEAESC